MSKTIILHSPVLDHKNSKNGLSHILKLSQSLFIELSVGRSGRMQNTVLYKMNHVNNHYTQKAMNRKKRIRKTFLAHFCQNIFESFHTLTKIIFKFLVGRCIEQCEIQLQCQGSFFTLE